MHFYTFSPFKLHYFALQGSATSNVKPDVSQWKVTLCYDVGFPTVNRKYTVATFWRHPIRRRVICASALELGDNCIQNVHLGRYNVDYMVGNFVLRRCVISDQITGYTSPNEHFEYGYPLSNALFRIYSSKAQHFAPNWSFVSNVKQLRQPITSDVTYDVGAPTVYCKIY